MRIDDNSGEVREQAQLDYFNYQLFVDHLKQEILAGNLSQFEARRRRCISARITAHEAIRYIFEDKVDRFQRNSFSAQSMSEEMGLANVDEIEFKHAVLKQMADMLRENTGNPFA